MSFIHCQRAYRPGELFTHFGIGALKNAEANVGQWANLDSLTQALNMYRPLGLPSTAKGVHASLRVGDIGNELAHIVFEPTKRLGVFMLPFKAEDHALLAKLERDLVSDWSVVGGIDEATMISLRVRVLQRGSVEIRFRDVLTGELVNGWSYQFIAMHERLYAAVRQVTARQELVGLLLSRMLLLGNLAPRVWDADLLARLAFVNAPVERLAQLAISGEIDELFDDGVAWTYIESFAGVAGPR